MRTVSTWPRRSQSITSAGTKITWTGPASYPGRRRGTVATPRTGSGARTAVTVASSLVRTSSRSRRTVTGSRTTAITASEPRKAPAAPSMPYPSRAIATYAPPRNSTVVASWA